MKIRWKDLGAKLSRVFTNQREAETALAELRRDGIHAEIDIPPASIPRLKPKSKPRVTGGRGTSIIGADKREIKVGERCFYLSGWRGTEWKRGTLERVKHGPTGRNDTELAWVRGKYLPWRMVSA